MNPVVETMFGAVLRSSPYCVLNDGWTVEAALDNAFVQTYRPGDPDEVIRLDTVEGLVEPIGK